MAKKIKYENNAPLEPGDKVICVIMDDEYSPVKPGTPGTVKRVEEVQGSKIYHVNWVTGSKLALLEGEDTWKKLVEISDEELFENVVLSTTKGKILKEIKR